MRLGTLVVLLLLHAGGRGWAAPAPKEHPAKADLIADVETVQPGKPFHLAVRITMQKGWHVYWISPGDSGQPTEVKFNVPTGWTIEPLPFPTPHTFVLPGDVTNYGYENEVLLIARVTPAADARGAVQLSAEVEWLVCSEDRCIPGKGSPTLSLGVGDASSPANEPLFKTWREQIPALVEGTWTAPADGLHRVGFVWPASVRNVEVYLAPGKGWLLKDQKLENEPNKSTVAFSARPIGKDKKPTDLVVLLAYQDAGGVRRSVQFTYPLTP